MKNRTANPFSDGNPNDNSPGRSCPEMAEETRNKFPRGREHPPYSHGSYLRRRVISGSSGRQLNRTG